MNTYAIKWYWRGHLRVLAANLTEEEASKVLKSGSILFPGKRLIRIREAT